MHVKDPIRRSLSGTLGFREFWSSGFPSNGGTLGFRVLGFYCLGSRFLGVRVLGF